MTFPGDQSPEEATCKTDDTSSPRLSGSSSSDPTTLCISLPILLTPTPWCFNTYVTQSPTSANPQDSFIYPLEVMFVIGKIPLEDDQALLWKLPSPSCLLNPGCAPRHCFSGTPPNGSLWCFHKPPAQSGVRQVFLCFIASSRPSLLHPSSKFLTPLKHTLFIYCPSVTVTHQLSCHITGMLPFTAPVIVLSSSPTQMIHTTPTFSHPWTLHFQWREEFPPISLTSWTLSFPRTAPPSHSATTTHLL